MTHRIFLNIFLLICLLLVSACQRVQGDVNRYQFNGERVIIHPYPLTSEDTTKFDIILARTNKANRGFIDTVTYKFKNGAGSFSYVYTFANDTLYQTFYSDSINIKLPILSERMELNSSFSTLIREKTGLIERASPLSENFFLPLLLECQIPDSISFVKDSLVADEGMGEDTLRKVAGKNSPLGMDGDCRFVFYYSMSKKMFVKKVYIIDRQVITEKLYPGSCIPRPR